MNKNIQQQALRDKVSRLYLTLEALNRDGHSYYVHTVSTGLDISAFKTKLEALDSDLTISINPNRTLYIKW